MVQIVQWFVKGQDFITVGIRVSAEWHFFFAKFALFPVTIFLRTFAHQITTEAEQLFRNILHHTQQVLRLWRNAKLFAQNY